ncbi:hypothetical protein GOP47_0017868 [Adiantum capillus-veneris]|uniref:PWI domain-containing protein n=1 Tax=Adiantum capillus-veneris TaxID=13818 RepID=A0A9D4UG97_ADICA|nr:hypothetical protein GOP47_0017868 [Adiantum capillus-veneris]
MSGGFFRGTSADQDTRFSNKTAKLLKTQKFAPELDQLIDMSKVHLDSVRPWIATRVTQLLGFEDEVLINFIYGLLEGKLVDGKQIQIQLTGFMEKNTGKFMKELWGLLTSAQNNMTGIPQQLLEEKAEEARLKKAEEQRVISEIRKKEEERRALEKDMVKKEREDERLDSANPEASKQRIRSSSRGGKSPDGDHVKMRNGKLDSKPLRSRSQSVSNVSSRSVSRSPPPTNKRRPSQSISRSPPRRFRRSRSPPRRGRSPNYRRRSRSPLRRANTRSPRRRRRSYSRSPRRRSPIPAARSPRRRHSPQLSHSPRGRSPIIRSPRRRHSPIHKRPSPRRRPSPPHSPRHRRRSPRSAHSPVRRHFSPPGHRRRSPQRAYDMSPRRRPRTSPRLVSQSPRLQNKSLSAEAFSKSPSPHRDSSSSPHKLSSMSPPHQSNRSLSPPRGKSSFGTAPYHNLPAPKGRPLRGSLSPVKQQKPKHPHRSSRSPSPRPPKKEESPRRNNRPEPVQRRALSPSLSPPRQQLRSSSLLEASPTSKKSRSRSPPTARELTRERPVKVDQRDFKTSDSSPLNRKRSRSSSRESTLPVEERQVAPLKKPSVSDAGPAGPAVVRHAQKLDESLSRSSNDDREASPAGKGRNMHEIESDGNDEHGPTSPVTIDDKKAVKRRKKEERRLRKEEKRRKREERHKRKEERRANKVLSKGIASVTPPPDFDKRTLRADDFDSGDEGKVHYDVDTEIEQRKLENELRRKALDSIKSKKVVST